MNLTDIFDISRTGSCVYLPSTVASSDNGLCDRDPWIVVAEDTGILFVSWWIRRNFTKLYVIFMIRWLEKHDAVFGIKVFLNRFHSLQAVALF